MIEPKIYNMKEEFWPLLGIPKTQWERRKDDLLTWFENFFDYEIMSGKPIRIKIIEVYGEYQPLPRKVSKTNREEKVKDYDTFTIASLGTEFKPNSKSKVAREAIEAFGEEKYGHTSVRAVTERFVKPAFEKYGESDGIHKWVWYSTYEELDYDTLARWRQIMSEEHISEQEAANAFYKEQQGEDISKEKGYFKNARTRFKEEYGSTPILVESWRVKKAAAQS